MEEHFTTAQAAEYLASVMPRPPAANTLMSFSRPAFRRLYPHRDLPRTAGKRGNRVIWARSELDAWARRRTERRARKYRPATPPGDWLTLKDVLRILGELMPAAAVPAASTLRTWQKPSGARQRPNIDMLRPRLRIRNRRLYLRSDVHEWIGRQFKAVKQIGRRHGND